MVKPKFNYGETLRVQVTEFKSCRADRQAVGGACPACRLRDNSLSRREFLSGDRG
jgi:phosphodiesterase/alkaline phosphatase D-like protein